MGSPSPSASQPGSPHPSLLGPCERSGPLSSSLEVEEQRQDRRVGKSEPGALRNHWLQHHCYQEGWGPTGKPQQQTSDRAGPRAQAHFLQCVDFPCETTTWKCSPGWEAGQEFFCLVLSITLEQVSTSLTRGLSSFPGTLLSRAWSPGGIRGSRHIPPIYRAGDSGPTIAQQALSSLKILSEVMTLWSLKTTALCMVIILILAEVGMGGEGQPDGVCLEQSL